MASRKRIKQQQKKRKLLGRFLFWLGLALIFGAGCYFIFFHSYFQIKKISFSGNLEIQTDKLENFTEKFQQKKWGFLFPYKNLIFFNSSFFKNNLQSQFLRIGDVKLKKIWPDKLQIKILERDPVAVFCPMFFKREEIKKEQTASQTKEFIESAQNLFWQNIYSKDCFYLDEAGFAFGRASLILGGRFPNIFKPKQKASILGKRVLEEKILSFVVMAREGLNSLNLEPYKFFINQRDKEVQVLIGGEWTLFLALDNQIEKQLLALKRSIEEEIKDDVLNLQYIDLRIPGRVYYKLK